MGCLLTGRFESAFPGGVQVEEKTPAGDAEKSDADKKEKKMKKLTGLKVSAGTCAVAVFTDVDFISDMVAYQNTIFGMVPVANNSDLLLNTIDDLGGSSELIALRSRGNFQRPFLVVEKIRKQAEEDTAQEEANINAEIAGFKNELQSIAASAKEGQQDVIKASIIAKQRELEVKIRQAERRLRDVQHRKFQDIDRLGRVLQNINMFSAATIVLAVAVILNVRRTLLRRRYISHRSDA
jgi:ABC-type uncharacterized transport system involved in gliding motility auxiliary subunit